VLAVVHNGVIENFEPIKERLQARVRVSVGDRQRVIAHLIASRLKRAGGTGPGRLGLRAAGLGVQEALSQLQGTFGLAMLFRDYPT